VSMIDVGQGDAVLVEFPGGETLLVDAGPLTPGGDAGKRTVVPFLKRRGIGALDVLLITHPDADHAGGAASLIQSIRVGQVIETAGGGTNEAYGRYRAAAGERGSPLSVTWRGKRIPAPECARLYVLWPPGPGDVPGKSYSPSGTNDMSVVFKLVYGGVSILFTGDAGRESEAGMMRSYGKFLSSTVLKVAHHGSDNGTSSEFLGAVHPAVALLSCGLHNRFRHPSLPLLSRLRGAGALILRTDAEGAVVLTSGGRRFDRLSWR
ncbi:MAG TPA: MBL fold metallo-hydrolase, partial [Bacteroidota bacterium]|nr:MBL fold metallo-hydrolase [Bacteroidota bacterium]